MKYQNTKQSPVIGIRFFVVFLMVVGSFLFVGIGKASAATYCMRADGTAANLAVAVGPASDVSKCMSFATHNALSGGGAPIAGDIFQLSSQGGDYNGTQLTGKFASVTYTKIAGENPIITGYMSQCVSVTANNVTIDSITCNGGSTYGMTASSGVTGLNLSNLSIGTSANYGIYLPTVSGSISDISGTSASTFIRLNACPSITLNGIINTGSGSVGLQIQSSANVIANNITISNKTSAAIKMTGSNDMSLIGDAWNLSDSNTGAFDGGTIYYTGTATNLKFQLSNLTINGGKGGLRILLGAGSTFTLDSKVDGFNISNTTGAAGIQTLYAPNMQYLSGTLYNNSGGGTYLESSPNSTVSHCVLSYNGVDGISFATNSPNGIATYNYIHHSGQNDVVANGDGLTCHASDTGMVFHHNLLYANRNSGMAFVDGCAGNAYNNVLIYNGDSASVHMGVRGGFYASSSSPSWNLKNNIFWGNYPDEIRTDSESIPTSDYNVFYHVGNNTVENNAFSLDNGSTQQSWSTYHASYDTNSSYGDPKLVSVTDYYFQPASPAIDAGTNVGFTSDYAGNPIYGLPDIGAYEYQPPYDMGTDEVDTSANVRVYGDGKFRNVDTAGGTTADLTVIPQGSQTTKWLDITKADDESSLIWQTNHKKWKESSTTLGDTDTLHTVGDLTAGKSYSLRIDNVLATANITGADCTGGVCVADESGEITFTYTGGYSDHSFDLNDDVAPVLSITSPEEGDTVSGDDTITFSDSEETDPQCSLNNTDWQDCESGVTSFSALTGWSSIAENDTFTLYLKDTDDANNTGTAQVGNLTKADTQAPIRSDGSPSGELTSSTTQTAISLETDENATCRYDATSKDYGDMANPFTTADGISHSATVDGLTSGQGYTYYVRCQDGSNNQNDTDYLISFSVANTDADDDDDEEDDQKARIDSWSAEKYQNPNTNCAERLKLTIKGKHFTNNTEVRIGGKEASSVDKKSSKKLIAKFCLPKLLDSKTDRKRSVSVKNPHAEADQADKKIDLDSLSEVASTKNLSTQTQDGIKNLQTALNKLGLLESQYITGHYGSITIDAVKKFQEQNGLPVTGYFGPLTRAKLMERM
jgi:hypothetical protein